MMNRFACAVAAACLAGCAGAYQTAAPDAAGPTTDAPAGDAAPAGATDAGAGTDAPAPDFTCYGATAPAAADDPLALAGTIETFAPGGGLQPVAGATLESFEDGRPVKYASTTSGATGAFAIQLATGAHPLAAYLKATRPQYRKTFLYPPSPFAKSTAGIPVPMMSESLFESVAGLLGATQDDAHDGALLVVVADCSGQPVAGATLSVTRGGHPVGQAYDLGAILPGAAGMFVVFDVPDGATQVGASYAGMTFPSHRVMARAQDRCPGSPASITATVVVPGP